MAGKLFSSLRVLGTLAILLFLFRSLPMALEQAPEKGIEVVRLDPRLDRILPPGVAVEKLTDGFAWVEGPVWNRRESCLLFSDIPNNSVFKWQEGRGVSLFLKPAGYTGAEPFSGREPGSNGLAFDAQGRLVLCEHGDRRVARLNENGTKTTLADRYRGKRLNSPNDLVFRSNGDLYFTDPPFGLPQTFDDLARELDFCGVYRLSSDGQLSLLTREIKAPNGIAFSPDEKKLYVTEVFAGREAWWVFEVLQDGNIVNGRVFYDAREWAAQYPGAPDGLKVDAQGNLFAAGPGGLYIFSPDAVLLGRIHLGVPTANCAWGEDGSTLFITANTAVYRVRLNAKGAGF